MYGYVNDVSMYCTSSCGDDDIASPGLCLLSRISLILTLADHSEPVRVQCPPPDLKE